MNGRTNNVTYTALAKLLHWTVAILFLVSYGSAYMRHSAGLQSDLWRTSGLIHRAAGLSIAVFVILRVYWRVKNPPPPLHAASGWEKRSATLVHQSLYFFMIAMPLTGYLGTNVQTDFGLFVVPNFAETSAYQWISGGLPFESWERPLDFFHRQIGGAKVVWILIAIHVGAALYHHVVRKDGVLLRMLPNR